MKQLKYIQSIQAKQQPTVLRFCTPKEQSLVKGHVPNAIFDGGYPDAERKRAYLFTNKLDNIDCLQIKHDSGKLTLSHQMILGNLMAIGIDRDMIGDILPKQGVFFVTSEHNNIVRRNLTTIHDVPISLSIIDGSAITTEHSFSEHQCITKSLRLDQIVRHFTSLSRQEAQFRIKQDDVKVNHDVVSKSTKRVEQHDLLSIRHFGRFIIDSVDQMTKKGNILVKYRKYE